MIIREPSKFTAQRNDRMPVVIDQKDAVDWLIGGRGLELLKPVPEDALKVWPVSQKVNSSRAPCEPGLVEPLSL